MARPSIYVLLVEDDSAEAQYVARMLKRAEDVEFAVEHVTSLKSALQVLQMSEPDIVLLDLSLPDSHGYDTVVEFTKHSNVPFIVLTGNDDLQMAMRAVGLGAQDYIIKGEAQAKPLERSVCVAAKRAANERVHRELEHKSRAMVFDEGDQATVSILRPQVSRLVEALEDLKQFLHLNAPGMDQDVKVLLDKYDTDVTVKNVRDTLRLHADHAEPVRSKKVSDAAIRAVDSVITKRRVSVAPESPAEADATLLDILSRREGREDG
jgi:DNA-binding response OmpR family regulator